LRGCYIVKEFYQGGVLDYNGDKTLYIQAKTLQNMSFIYNSSFWTMSLTYIIVYILNMSKRDIVDTLYHALCVYSHNSTKQHRNPITSESTST
jgi:hypothetical protein